MSNTSNWDGRFPPGEHFSFQRHGFSPLAGLAERTKTNNKRLVHRKISHLRVPASSPGLRQSKHRSGLAEKTGVERESSLNTFQSQILPWRSRFRFRTRSPPSFVPRCRRLWTAAPLGRHVKLLRGLGLYATAIERFAPIKLEIRLSRSYSLSFKCNYSEGCPETHTNRI